MARTPQAPDNRVWKLTTLNGARFYGNTKKGKVFNRLNDATGAVGFNGYWKTQTDDPRRKYKTPEEYLEQFSDNDYIIEYELVEVKRTSLKDMARERIPHEVYLEGLRQQGLA